MRGSSAESLTRLTEQLAAAVTAEVDGVALGNDLFSVASALRTQVAVRRAVTDPSAPAEAKAGLMRNLFGSRVSSTATELLTSAGGMRWASSSDLVTALDQLAVVAIVRAADAIGEGARLESELFDFSRIVADNRDLRSALSDPARSVANKQELITGLLSGRMNPGALRLALESVSDSHHSAASALNEYVALAAEARNRVVALAHVAKPLTQDELARLTAVLTHQAGRPVHVNVVVDPAVVGGIFVKIGDEVIDGTIASRVDGARRQLVG